MSNLLASYLGYGEFFLLPSIPKDVVNMLESSEMFHGHLLSALGHISSLVSIMYLDIDLINQTYIVFKKVHDNLMVYEIGSLFK